MVKLASSAPGAFSGHVMFWFSSTLGKIVYLLLFHIRHTIAMHKRKEKILRAWLRILQSVFNLSQDNPISAHNHLPGSQKADACLV